MAGAGYKLFNTGDVLTAAQVNTYLQEQTVMVFADAAARTTALSGVLAEGMITYLKSTDAVEVYNGSAWVNVASDQTPLTTKGDLFTYSTTDARLAVGNNGETLVADSSATTGLRWQGSTAAGRNFVINGGFDIWQRGTASQTPANGAQLNVDRFYYAGTSGVVFTQDTDVPTDPYFQYSVKTVDGSNYGMAFGQKIEAANAALLAGKTITVSFYAKMTSGTATMSVNAYYPSAKDNFASNTLIASNTVSTPTSSWARYQTTFSLPSNVQNGLLILIVRGSTTNTTLYTGLQAELGSIATPFSRAGGTIAGELAACQRYYQFIGGTASQFPIATGYASASSQSVRFPLQYPVQMRTAPVITKNGTWATGNCGQPSAVYINNQGFSIEFTSTGAGQCYVYPDGTDDTMTISAEL